MRHNKLPHKIDAQRAMALAAAEARYAHLGAGAVILRAKSMYRMLFATPLDTAMIRGMEEHLITRIQYPII